MGSMHLFLFFLLLCFAMTQSSSSHISTEVVEAHGLLGRSLLQQKTSCPVDFANMNYSVITSQCKGPNYTPERCCVPLKQLLCPVKDQINDLNSNCADTFFSYVNIYGNYPPGLFASLCKEGEEGLDCESVQLLPPPPGNGAFRGGAQSPSLMLIAGLVMLIVFYF